MFVMELRTKHLKHNIELEVPSLMLSNRTKIIICIHALEHGHIFTVYVGRKRKGGDLNK